MHEPALVAQHLGPERLPYPIRVLEDPKPVLEVRARLHSDGLHLVVPLVHDNQIPVADAALEGAPLRRIDGQHDGGDVKDVSTGMLGEHRARVGERGGSRDGSVRVWDFRRRDRGVFTRVRARVN